MISGVKLLSSQDSDSPFTPEVLASRHSGWAVDRALFDSEQDSWDAPVLICDQSTSTMEAIAPLVEAGDFPAWGSLLAVSQKSGRGQLRRWWSSEPGNLHVSFLLPGLDGVDPLWNRMLPLVLGRCIRNGLKELGADTILKWPNDLIQLQGEELRKTCGLLIEDRAGRTLAGLGVNLTFAPGFDQLRDGAAFQAGILRFSHNISGPLGVWLKLVNLIKKEYQALLDHSHPRAFINEVSDELLWMGQEVSLQGPDGPRRVKLLGLAPDGGLRLLGGTGEEIIYSGSISNRFQADVRP